MESILPGKDTDLSRRRRAVYSALLPFLDQDQLYRAMWLWEEKYANVPPMQLRRFVSEITDHQFTVSTVTSIHVQLVAANFINNVDKLEPDPMPWMLEYKNGDTSVKRAPAATLIFQTMVNAMTSGLDEKDKSEVFLRYKKRVNFKPLGMVQQHELNQWINNKKARFNGTYHVKAMQLLINCLYVCMCESIGPIIADKHLEEAIRMAESLPEAKHFPPTNLL